MDPFYDDFSEDYDRFVNWQGRLALELPFITQTLSAAPGRTVLDAACGTGMHAIALAQAGFAAAGADLSAGMIAQARGNAAAAGAQVRFEPAGFGALEQTFGAGSFAALLCLGNSLPHLLSADALAAALADFAAVLAPGGVLILQNRNFDQVMASRGRWMEPQAARQGDREWIFLRFYDFEPEGMLTFHVLSLKRQGEASWQQTVRSTPLRPLLAVDLQAALAAAGFIDITVYGSLAGAAFDPAASPNLVLTARRP